MSCLHVAAQSAVETTSTTPSSADSVLGIADRTWNTTPLLRHAEHPPLVSESERQISLQFSSSPAPSIDRQLSYSLGINFSYGWSDQLEINLLLPELLTYDGTNSDIGLLGLIGFGARTSFFQNQLIAGSHVSVDTAGVRLEAVVTGMFNFSARLQTSFGMGAVYRSHVSLPNYSLSTVRPAVLYSPLKRVSFGLSLPITFLLDRVETIAHDEPSGRHAFDPSVPDLPAYILAVSPEFKLALNPTIDVGVVGKWIANKRARAWFGHEIGMNFQMRM